MLPRINSGEVLSCQEHRQSMDNDDAVLVPKAVPESSEVYVDRYRDLYLLSLCLSV